MGHRLGLDQGLEQLRREASQGDHNARGRYRRALERADAVAPSIERLAHDLMLRALPHVADRINWGDDYGSNKALDVLAKACVSASFMVRGEIGERLHPLDAKE